MTAEFANSPFVIGMTGHPDTDPAELPRLVEPAAALIAELKSIMPDTDLRLMLVAEDPLVQTLRTALSAAVQDIEVPDADSLVHRISLLVAFWDGSPSVAANDTADLVMRFLGARAHEQDHFDEVSTAPASDDVDEAARVVLWIPVTRRGSVEPPRITRPHYLLNAREHVLGVLESMPSSLQRRLANLNEFNSEARYGTAVEGPGYSLLEGIATEFLASNAAVLQAIDRQYLKADALAVRMQIKSDRLFNLFGVSAAMMGLAYLIYEKITNSRLLLIFYLVILAMSLGSYYALQSRRWFGRHLAHRALAETLRVRFYLALAGINHRMHARDLIELTGIHQFRGFGWINFVLDAIEPVKIHVDHGAEEYARRAELVDGAWIGSQYDYFRRKVTAMHKVRRRVKAMKLVVLIAALAVIATMFVFGDGIDRVDARIGLPIKNVLTFCSGLLAVLLGVWELRQNKMATQELLWQYSSQLDRLERARLQLQRITNRTRRDMLLLRLSDSSVMEIYLWAIHRYHREHAPSGGL